VVTPAGRKVAVRHLIEQHRISEWSACQLVGISRSAFRYQARARNDHALRARLRELAAQQSAYGYLFLHSMLKTEGLVINRKRTYRIYTEEKLQVRTKRRKKLQRPRQPLEVPRAFNDVGL
tara:strand:- start:11827 stop:12189 length:363 start_codon:yes stop_codon:yes gene_type:complete